MSFNKKPTRIPRTSVTSNDTLSQTLKGRKPEFSTKLKPSGDKSLS